MTLQKGGEVGGGTVDRYVPASNVREAREAAVASAEHDLRRIAAWDRNDPPRWSVDAVWKGRLEDGDEAFRFSREDDDRLSPTLARLAWSLARNDLHLHTDEGKVAVVAESEGAFTVALHDEEEGYTVSSGDWHGHYEDAEQAVACFRWLLTPYYRVATERQDGELSAAWIERYGNSGWHPMDSMLFRNPDDPTQWLGKGWVRERRQQAVLRPPEPYTELFPEVWLDDDGTPHGSVMGVQREIADRSFAVEQGWLDRGAP